MRPLILWDIDHTLIDTRGVGRKLSEAAFLAATGHTMRHQAKIDGITEPVIFRETARLHGLATDRSDFERFASALTTAHLQRIGELRKRGRVLPGAAAALNALAARDFRQTVVSGNIRAVAEIKLGAFGLDQHICWMIGAYGDDSEARADLVRLALHRANSGTAEAVLIGDTPADVEAARTSGVRVVAVASGRSDEAALRKAGAYAVLPDLNDTTLLVQLILDTTT